MSVEKAVETPKDQKLQVPPSGLTPEMLAYINSTTAATIKEVIAGMMPVISQLAMTPEKIALAEEIRRRPTAEQEAMKAREKRERLLTQQEASENAANKRALQENCAHRYPTGQLSVSTCRNYPDRQPRFLCHLCTSFFTPREWRIGPPDAENPRGVPFVAEPHPQYREISALMQSRLQE
jgi:hypothetical protein